MGSGVAPHNEDLLIGIGDIHGHYPALESLLRGLDAQYGIFSAGMRLRPGVRLVNTGDYIDRGVYNLKVLDTLMELKALNPQAVSQLFGNHELLALAALSEARELAENKSPDNLLFYSRATIHGYNGGDVFVREFAQTPEELFPQYVARMSRDGDIGSWMRGLSPVVQRRIGNQRVVFFHAGIAPDVANPLFVQEFSELFDVHMARDTAKGAELKYLRSSLVDQGSPFWIRNIPGLSSEQAHALTDSLQCDYLVVGHTPQQGGIANYGNRIFNIDVGMCPAYGENEPAAIVFKQDGVYGFYSRQGERKIVSHESKTPIDL